MRLLIFPALALTGALVAVVPAIDLAAAPPNRPRNIKVVVEFPLDETNNKIQSDTQGAYQDGVDGVNAYIAASSPSPAEISHAPGFSSKFSTFITPSTTCIA